jgi:hypothetical protein
MKQPATGGIAGVRFTMYGNGSGNGSNLASGQREFFFNNMLLVPEPASLAVLILAAPLLACRRRRS